MHKSLVRPEPAELLFVGELALEFAKAGHDLLDVVAHKLSRVKFRRAAHQVVSLAESESEARANEARFIMEQRGGVGVNGIAVDGVAAVAGANREAGVAGRDVLDHRFLAAIAEFRAAGDMHEVAGNEAGVCGKEINRGLGNDIALRAKSERVDIIEVARYADGIGLLGGPLAEHRSPDTGGANGVDPDTVDGVVKGHRFCEGVHRAFGGRVGGVDFLPDLTDQAAGVQDASARGFERLEAMLRRPINALHIDGKKAVPLRLGGFMQGGGRRGDPGIIVDRVQTAELGENLADRSANLRAVGNIAAKPDVIFTKRLCSLPSLFQIRTTNGHLRPLAGIGLGALEANSRRTAGKEDGFFA